jgi:hypothetical protein
MSLIEKLQELIQMIRWHVSTVRVCGTRSNKHRKSDLQKHAKTCFPKAGEKTIDKLLSCTVTFFENVEMLVEILVVIRVYVFLVLEINLMFRQYNSSGGIPNWQRIYVGECEIKNPIFLKIKNVCQFKNPIFLNSENHHHHQIKRMVRLHIVI